jgi:hypothetical protein
MPLGDRATPLTDRKLAMNDILNQGMRWVSGLDKQDWLFVLTAALVIGFIALQGFGSRSNY